MSEITTNIDVVLNKLRDGDIAAIPTETVYGLAADASSDSAIKKVFATKKRPRNHPLIMHIAPQWDITEWVSHIPDYAYAFMQAYWPGPLTLLLPIKSGAINPLITGGQTSIAIRAPDHAITTHLLLKFGKPLVAPSANPYGKISPTTAQHVKNSFPKDDFFILDGGRCRVGVESTIINALNPLSFEISRPGIINEEQLLAVASLNPTQSTTHIRVPGGTANHYQPEKKLYYVENIAKATPWLDNAETKPYVLTFSKNHQGPSISHYEFPENSDAAAYELYYRLRIADQSEAGFIVIELPPNDPAWLTIRERILKAGSPMNLNQKQ